ncbi:MAG TPA: DUF1320 domain-containing protein [Pyrinomonadaceae bacterium]|nr:DUF1320 domain-containing protein [Pyrinomonadaceae bacterium]
MAYISTEDLIDELGEGLLVELTDDNDTGEINENVITKAIDYAVGTFEAYARTRYSLPVPATALVKSRCLDLAIYKLFRKRAEFDEGVFKVKKTAHDETISFLKDLQAGRAALDIPATEETIESPATGDQILSNKSNSKFTDEKFKGF